MILEFEDDYFNEERVETILFNLEIARAKLKAVCAMMKDNGDEKMAEIISEIDSTVFGAEDFLRNIWERNMEDE